MTIYLIIFFILCAIIAIDTGIIVYEYCQNNRLRKQKLSLMRRLKFYKRRQ